MSTLVWLITYEVDGEKRQVVHGHNAVADYRDFDPQAAARQIDVAAVVELIVAARSLHIVTAGLRPDIDANERADVAAALARVGGAA
jgi:hypothetical protein